MLFRSALFLLILFVCPSSAVRGDQLTETNQWWPSAKINPPEVEAFFMVVDESTNGVYVFPQVTHDPRVVMIEWEPETILDAEGKFVAIGLSVLVTKRVKSRYILRQFRYHHVWTGDLNDLFYDMSFLSRTADENKKLAYADENAYWKSVMEAILNVNRDVVSDIVNIGREFSTAVVKGFPATAPAHQALELFVACVDHVFRQAYEPYVGVFGTDFDKLFLIFDYDPWHKNQFNLKTATLFLVPLAGSGISVFLFGKEQLVAEVSIPDACSGQYAGMLAKQAFRALIDLRAMGK